MAAVEERAKTIEALLEGGFEPASPGCAIAVTKGTQTLALQTRGLANLEFGVPIGVETVFHAASVSKQVTAMAILMLEQEGRLSLNDRAVEWLDDMPPCIGDVRIVHLLTHTSGIREQWDLLLAAGWRLDDVITQDDVRRIIRAQQHLNFPSGSRMMYCNSGYSLLADIVERASGVTFREFCQDRIFEPLGMARSHFRDDHEEVVENRAQSYRENGEHGFRRCELNFGTVGATGLQTTISDLARWLQNLEEPIVGGREVVARMQIPAQLSDGSHLDYGLGLKIRTLRGERVVGHDGSDAGFRACVLWSPKAHVGVAVLSNFASVSPFTFGLRVMEAVRNIDLGGGGSEDLSGREGADVAHAVVDPNEEGGLVGTYASEELRTVYTIERDGNSLVLRQFRHGSAELQAIDRDRYRGPGWAREILFLRDSGEEISGFELRTGRLCGVEFRKIGGHGE